MTFTNGALQPMRSQQRGTPSSNSLQKCGRSEATKVITHDCSEGDLRTRLFRSGKRKSHSVCSKESTLLADLVRGAGGKFRFDRVVAALLMLRNLDLDLALVLRTNDGKVIQT